MGTASCSILGTWLTRERSVEREQNPPTKINWASQISQIQHFSNLNGLLNSPCSLGARISLSLSLPSLSLTSPFDCLDVSNFPKTSFDHQSLSPFPLLYPNCWKTISGRRSSAVFSWILQNLDSKLITRFAQHQTAKALWESLATTYGAESVDPFQIYDLEVKTNKVSQGQQSFEDYWSSLQALWLAVDQRDPHPINCCEKGINQYGKLISVRRLYQFLSGLDGKFDGIRRDILKEHPSPSIEAAFAKVRREATWLQIMQPTTKSDQEEPGIAAGLATRTRTDSHCGMRKHTRENCFKLVGYPEWWEDNHKTPTAKGKVVVGQGGDGDNGTSTAMVAASTMNGKGKGAEIVRKEKTGEEDESAEGYSDWGNHWTWH